MEVFINMNKWILFIKVICCSFILPTTSYAIDVIHVTSTQSILDKRAQFKNEVLKRTMQITVDEYGPYEFIEHNIRMNRPRALLAIIKGEPSNVYVAPSSPEWNKKTIAIKVPIRLGLLSYRLLLIHKDDAEKFSKVNSVEDLKKMQAGLRSGWVTTDIFKKQKFDIAEAQNFDGLFLLLDNHRFNYIPRSIYEIYDEVESRQHLISNVVVENHIALHIPTSTYIYVSPTEPQLAKRIEKGITRMYKNGDLLKLVNRYYADDVKKANLKGRTIIQIENPLYTKEDQINDSVYQYPL